jgi:hypothetical protein
VASAVEQEYKHTVSSLQLQPYKNADTQLQFCTAFDPQRYLQALSSARQLAEDVEGLGCWLAQLSPSGHVISVSSGRSRDSSSNESVHQHRGSIDGSTHSSRPGRGLVEVDVSAVRPALLKTGRAAFG